MTLLQLKYIMEIYNSGSINQAAKNLFMSQSTISVAIKEVEEELGITIFNRTNRGIEVTEDGQEFIANIIPLLEQEKRLNKYYKSRGKLNDRRFSLSMQRYSFCVKAFVEFLKEHGDIGYDFKIIECDMPKVISDVSTRKSEIGILFYSDISQRYLQRTYQDNKLEFKLIKEVKPHVFFREGHPLADKDEVSLEELADYPCVIFEKGEESLPGFEEEVGIGGKYDFNKTIEISDRATLYNIICNTDAFSTGSGIIPEGYGDDRLVIKPLSDDIDNMHLGYIKIQEAALSEEAKEYIKALKEVLSEV